MNTFDIKQAAIKHVERVSGHFDITNPKHVAAMADFTAGVKFAITRPTVFISGIYEKEHAKLSIVDVVCEFYNITMPTMQTRSRKTEVVRPRQILSKLLCDVAKISTTEVSRLFYQDHTTVCHSISAINALLQTDESFQKEFQQLIVKISQRIQPPTQTEDKAATA